MAITIENPVTDNDIAVDERGSRPEKAVVFNLEVLISRTEDGETRGRAANLPLRETQAASVRETLQSIIEQARELISESLAGDKTIPRIDPPSAPLENESRFVVPLMMS